MFHFPAYPPHKTLRCRQPPTGITRHRFSHHPLSLATTHGVSFPAGTEMFHFPAYPPHKTLRCRPTTAGGLPHSDTLGSKPCRRLPEAYRGPTRPSSVPGYPIRTPSDQSPVGGSPRPIAAPHVLHRYCLPRHPPYAHGNKPTNPRKKGGHGPMPLALEHPTTTNQII